MSRSEKVSRLYYSGLFAMSILAASLLLSAPATARGQVQTAKSTKSSGHPSSQPSGKRSAPQDGKGQTAGGTETPEGTTSESPVEEEMMVRNVMRRFSESYRLGAADAVAIRVKGQPDYSLERVKVSPMGTIYHPLLGDLNVTGMTLDQLKKQLTTDLSEYILDPIVSLELIEAQSAKIGVIGEVKASRVIVMTGPMTIVDAITEAGGVADTGNKSKITLLRQNLDGSRGELTVNYKNILEGKARPEDNLALQAGDLVIVHGNKLKAFSKVAAITGFTSLLSLIQLGSR